MQARPEMARKRQLDCPGHIQGCLAVPQCISVLSEMNIVGLGRNQ
jgi:hypothetical protein